MVAALCGGFKPQPSPLMLRHPFAGHALGLGDLVGGVYTFNPTHQRIIELSFPAGLVHRTVVFSHRSNQWRKPR